MCDMPEEEFAEYLLWLEAARLRAKVSRQSRVKAPIEAAFSTFDLAEVPA